MRESNSRSCKRCLSKDSAKDEKGFVITTNTVTSEIKNQVEKLWAWRRNERL
jgi:RNA polymerase subunit RPABC4/transcription elongation factor Spt4